MPATIGRSTVDVLTNKSGGSVAKGDVVILDASNDTAFTTTTTGRYAGAIGVVLEENGIASNASGRVAIAGRVPLVNVPASVTRGHYVETHTVVKQATGNATRRSGSFGVFLTGGTTPQALLFGLADGSTVGGTFDVDTHLPWRIEISPWYATANTNWSSQSGIDANTIYQGTVESSGAQNAEITFGKLTIAAGTWTIFVLGPKGTDRGIMSLQFDGSEVGTIDTYNGSLARNQAMSATGISVATTGAKSFKVKMATKNASSSSYFGTIQHITLVRTA